MRKERKKELAKLIGQSILYLNPDMLLDARLSEITVLREQLREFQAELFND
mgnify:CR=1 FL=1